MMVETAGGSGLSGMTTFEPLGAGRLNVECEGGGNAIIRPIKAMVAIHRISSFGSTAKAE